jgi:hypothetical protein
MDEQIDGRPEEHAVHRVAQQARMLRKRVQEYQARFSGS